MTSSSSNSNSKSKSKSNHPVAAAIFRVPALTADELDSVSEEAFSRYTCSNTPRNGSGVSIVWFRNDLRILDNEVLNRAWMSSEKVLPVYCVDPRLFGTTHYFGFPKTGANRREIVLRW